MMLQQFLKRILVYWRQPAAPPWWKAHFGIQQDLHQSLKSALLFVPVKIDILFYLSDTLIQNLMTLTNMILASALP